MTSGAVMEVKNRVVYMSNIDDGTGNNPQTGYFAVKEMVGPFLSKKDTEKYLKETS